MYIRDTLESDLSFQELKKEDDKYVEIIQYILEAAKGVFLWVVLVVKSLLEGLTNSDRLSDMQKRLKIIPTDLDNFFEQILFTVDDFHREETAYAFQITLAAQSVLPLMAYWFIDQEETHPVLNMENKSMSVEEFRIRQEQMTKRFNARCKRLLEVQSHNSDTPAHWLSSNSNLLLTATVDFLDRTLRDFLRIPKTQKLLTRWSCEKLDPNIAICKAMLANQVDAAKSDY